MLAVCQALCLSHPPYSHLILTTRVRGRGPNWATDMHFKLSHNLQRASWDSN